MLSVSLSSRFRSTIATSMNWFLLSQERQAVIASAPLEASSTCIPQKVARVYTTFRIVALPLIISSLNPARARVDGIGVAAAAACFASGTVNQKVEPCFVEEVRGRGGEGFVRGLLKNSGPLPSEAVIP